MSGTAQAFTGGVLALLFVELAIAWVVELVSRRGHSLPASFVARPTAKQRAQWKRERLASTATRMQ